jgi:hypothetical protein
MHYCQHGHRLILWISEHQLLRPAPAPGAVHLPVGLPLFFRRRQHEQAAEAEDVDHRIIPRAHRRSRTSPFPVAAAAAARCLLTPACSSGAPGRRTARARTRSPAGSPRPSPGTGRAGGRAVVIRVRRGRTTAAPAASVAARPPRRRTTVMS